MITRYQYKQITWIDLVKPTADEIREVVAETGIPPEFSTDLGVMVPHSESTAKAGILKVVLDFPVVRRTDMKHPHELKFVVTKKHLVTFHYEEMEAIHRFGKEFEVRCLLQNGKRTTPPRLFISLMEYLYDATYLKLDHLEARLHEVEEGIFSAKEREMVFEISDVTRRLIAFRQVLGAHGDVLPTLHTDISTAFGKSFSGYIDSLRLRHEHLTRRLTALTSVAADLRSTNQAILSTKENEIMKMFTILAFITFPLTLFTSTFGMNTENTPILGVANDFWIIVGIMVVVSAVFFIVFKYKRWL